MQIFQTEGLTKKQAKYLIELTRNKFNEYRSAIAAGYSHYTSVRIGDNLRKTKNFVKFMKNIEEIDEKYIISGINEIASDTDAQKRDRLKGYELLGKWKALFTDKSSIEIKDMPEIVVKKG